MESLFATLPLVGPVVGFDESKTLLKEEGWNMKPKFWLHYFGKISTLHVDM